MQVKKFCKTLHEFSKSGKILASCQKPDMFASLQLLKVRRRSLSDQCILFKKITLGTVQYYSQYFESYFIFATPETTDRLGTSTQTVPEGNATNTGFKRTNNTQSLAGANRAVIRTMYFSIA